MCQLSESSKKTMAIVTSESSDRVPCALYGKCEKCELEHLIGTKPYNPDARDLQRAAPQAHA